MLSLPRLVSWSSLCPNSTLWALGRVPFTSTQSITILLLIRNSLCLLFSQVEQNDIKSPFSSRGSPNGWTDAWGTIKERRKSFISLHISSGIDFGVLEGYLAFRNFWSFELAPHPTKIWFYTETLNEQHSFILTLCYAMYICTGRFSAGLRVWLTTFISRKVPCKFRFCRFNWRFHRNRDNTMTSMLEKWGQRGQFLQLWSWTGSSWSKVTGPSE